MIDTVLLRLPGVRSYVRTLMALPTLHKYRMIRPFVSAVFCGGLRVTCSANEHSFLVGLSCLEVLMFWISGRRVRILRSDDSSDRHVRRRMSHLIVVWFGRVQGESSGVDAVGCIESLR
jgi:hypothetical protein